ncbi:MAG: DUF1003 domain-containing protein [Proteobacteria bacterium]|nr:DUF1003 domain-containing protein [Pseudomonadota bacterium]
MTSHKHKNFECQVCRQEKSANEILPASLVRAPLIEVLKKSNPNWSSDGYICNTDLNHVRNIYVEQLLQSEKGELSKLESDVVENIKRQELVTENVETAMERQLTLGERMADSIASFGGSWWFLSLFALVLFVWIAINSVKILSAPFDPFPFILLNLVLSCIAAVQAPVIMMSQNRQESKDRVRSENDYRINLKAELEIRHLHAKIDLLLTHQWQRLLEIQQIQMEMMEQIGVAAAGKFTKTV